MPHHPTPPIAIAGQDELRATAERLQLALAAAELGTWSYEAASGLITFDERSRTHLGLAGPGPFSMAEFEARLHPEDIGRVRAEILASLEPGRSAERFAHEYRVVHEDGAVHWLSVQVSVHFDGEGEARRPSFTVGTTCDITGRRLAEEALRESETVLRAVFEGSRDAIGLSLKGTHVLANPAYLALFGFSSSEELAGLPVLDLIAPESRPRVAEYLRSRSAGTARSSTWTSTSRPTSSPATSTPWWCCATSAPSSRRRPP